MRSARRWIALMLVVTLISGVGIYQYGNPFKADEDVASVEAPAPEPAPEPKPEPKPEPATQAPAPSPAPAAESNDGGVAVSEGSSQDTGQQTPEQNQDQEKEKFKIKIDSPTANGGLVSVSGKSIHLPYSATVEEDSRFSFKIDTSDSAYEVKKVTDKGGKSISHSGDTYTINEVNGNYSIEIEYEKSTATGDGNGTVEQIENTEPTEETEATEPTETTEPTEATEEENPMPAQKFSGIGGGLYVNVSAPEGAFPADTKMNVSGISRAKAIDMVEGAVDNVEDAKGVDISFSHDGKEIQPQKKVTVSLSGGGVDGDAFEICHVSDGGSVNVVANASDNGGSCKAKSFSAYIWVGYVDYVANKTYEIEVGESLTISCGIGDNYNSWQYTNNGVITSNAKDGILREDRDLEVTGAKAGTVTITHKYTPAFGSEKTETFTIKVVEAKEKAPVKVKVTFNKNKTGGTAAPDAITTEANGTITLPNYTGTKTGYVFAGWSTNSSTSKAGEGVYSAGAQYTVGTSDVTLYAVWAKNRTISFDKNKAGSGTGGVPGNITGAEGSVVTLPNYTGTNGTKSFVGWSTSSGGPVQYYAGDAYTIGSSDVKFYAIYGDSKLEVKFDANGGNKTAPASQKVDKNTEIELPGYDGTRDGDTFAGWSTNSKAKDGDAGVMAAGDKYNVTAGVTLYAVWSEKTKITYDKNGGDANAPPAQIVEAGEEITLPEYTGTNDGDAFVGWSTDKNANAGAEGVYPAGSKYTMGASSVTMYAVWEGKIKVTFDKNGGNANPPAAIRTDANSTIVLPEYTGTKSNQVFVGWSKSNTAKATDANVYLAGDDYTVGNKAETLYVVWADKVTLTFNANGGNAAAPAAMDVKKGGVVTLPNYTGTNGNKVFIGWCTYSKVVTSTGRVEEGYAEKGKWPNLVFPVYPAGSEYAMGDSNVTLYAIWAEENLDAEFFIRKDGTIPVEPQPQDTATFTSGIKVTGALKEGKFCADAVDGVGYNLAKEPTAAQIKSVLSSYDPDTQYVLWYVIKHFETWHVDGVVREKSKVALSYNPNAPGISVTNMPNGAQYTKGAKATVSDKIPLRTGYTFVNWNTEADGTGTAYSPSAQITMNNDVSLYAQWKANSKTEYTVQYFYEKDGAYSEQPTSSVKRYGETNTKVEVTEADKTPKAGYVFDSGAANKLSGTVTPDGSLVLKVYFKQKKTITVEAKSDTVKYNGADQTLSGFNTLEFTFGGKKYTVSGLSASATGKDAGEYALNVTGTAVVKDASNKDVTSQFEVNTRNGKLTIEKRSVSLTSPTTQKTYDGTALTNKNITVGGDGFASGEGASYNVTGTQTDPGTSTNAFTYTLNENTKASNYNISKTEGTLTVNPITTPIKIKAGSATKTYDGTPLTKNEYTYTQNVLAKGDVLTAVVSGTITDAGTAANVVTSYKVMRGETNVTANYNFEPSEGGTLTVNKRNVTLTSATDSKTYDGQALTNHDVAVSGDGFVEGQGANYNVTGTQTEVGTSNNAFTYTLKTGTKAGNYNITTIEGTLTVSKSADAITIIANSQSRAYDGTALTNGGHTYVGKLAEGDTITAVVEGTITDVGTADNVVKSYKIMRGGKDVTSNYTVTTQNGTLEVTKRNVTLTSGTSTKEYDGTALTNNKVTVGGDGFAGSDGATYDVTGSQTEVGSSDNTFKYELKAGTKADNYNISKTEGTLTVTKSTKPIIITAGSASKVYDGTALTNGNVTYTAGVLTSGDVIVAETQGTITDAGTADNVVKSYKVMRGTKDVTNYYTFGEPVKGTLEVTKRPVTLTSASDSKTYDGTALRNKTVTDKKTGTQSGTGFVAGEGATYNVTGSQTDVGSSKNTFSYTLNEGTKAGNYTITKDEGTLTVRANTSPITITAKSASKTYDGTPLTKNDFTYTSGILAEGDVLTATVAGTITDAGTAANKVTGYKVMRGEKDVTSNYVFNNSVDGTLTVNKRNVTLTSADATKAYDGTPLTNNNVTVSGDKFAAGEGAAYNVTGSQTDVGTSKNNFDYTLNAGTKAGNYNITVVKGDLTVTKSTSTIVITANSKSKMYDGEALTDAGFTYTGTLAEGDRLTATVEGTITDAGTADNVVTSYKVMRSGKDVTDNYSFGNSVKGTLTVTKRNVVMTSGSASKPYDGTALTKHTVEVTGDGFVKQEGADYTYTGTQTKKGSSANGFTYELKGGAKAGNYNITTVPGTLTVTAKTDDLTITANSASKMYDGTALTDAGFTYTEGVLAAGDRVNATVTGTITNAGEVANEITAYTITNQAGDDVTDNYKVATVDGKLTVSKRTVTLTSGSDTKTYDGTALTKDSVEVGGNGFVDGEGAAYNVTGSQTNVGNSKNTFTYTLNEGTAAGNYDITKIEGTLTVTKNATPIIITAGSDTKVYDGTALKKNAFTYTQNVLAEGDVLTAVIKGSITDVGTADNVVESYQVMRGAKDVTSYYTFGDSVKGTLEVTKKTVTLTSGSDSKMYDGTALTKKHVTADGFVGTDGATYDVTGSQTDVGTSKNDFTYELKAGTKADNYDIKTVKGDLTVTKNTTPIVVKAASADKKYDGTALTDGGYSYTQGIVAAQDRVVATVEGTITDAGAADNVVTDVKIMRGEQDVTAYYTLGTPEKGTLEVTKRTVKLTSGSSEKAYDGSPLTNGTVTPGVDGFASGEGANYSVTGSQTDVGESDNTFTYTLKNGTKASNYDITTEAGKLKVTANTTEIIITADSATRKYNGNPLTKDTFTYTQGVLASGDVLEATVEGTITDAGTADNVVTGYRVMRGQQDVTGNYTFGTPVNGTLTVNKRDVTLTSSDASKAYDGTPLTKDEVTVSGDGFAGEEFATYDVTGSRTNVGTSKNTFTYELANGAKAGNYNITTVEGNLTVTKNANTIVITAASDSKTYDGSPLTNNGYTYTEGVLASGDVLTATVEGTITDFGTAKNEVTGYKVMNGGEDVTDNYTFGNSVDGTLSITKRAVVLTSGDGEKAYDGTALTNNTVTAEGFVGNDGAEYDVTGSQTDVGSSDNNFTYELKAGTKADNYDIRKVKGTLTVTKKEAPIVITAGSATKTYDGTALTKDAYTYTDGVLVNGDILTATVEGSIKNAGTAANQVTSYKVMRGGTDVTGNYTFGAPVAGTLTVNKRNVTIVSASAEKTYDGTALTKKEVTATNFADGEGITYNVTGSQTDVGTSDNTFTYELKANTKADNYNITKTEGKLKVKKVNTPIIITANSDSKTYDGAALTNDGFSYTQNVLAGGDVLTATVEGTITDAGSVANKVTSYKVMRGETDVTSNYTFGNAVDGTLTVNKRNVTLTSSGATKQYDGKPLTKNEVTVSGDGFAANEGAAYDVTGSRTRVGTSKNTFTYTLNEGTKADNYNITTVEGDLTVSAKSNTITITAASDNKTYDGTPLTNNGYTYTENVLAEGDVLTATVEGTITDAGTEANVVTGYKVMNGGDDVTDNYTFADPVDGTLTVTKRSVSLTSASDSKIYDGTPLTNHDVTVGGDGFAEGEGATYDVTGSIKNQGSTANTFTYTLNEGTKAGNYNITTHEGTLTVSKKNVDIIITANSETRTYNGAALTNAGYSYNEEGLAAGDSLTATVEGSRTDAGSSANTVTGYEITNGAGEVVTGNYNVQTANGTLTVDKRPVTLTSATDSKEYDGKALTNKTVTVTEGSFADGEGATYDVTGTRTKVGEADNEFTYQLNEGTKAGNYTITKVVGKLTVTKNTTPIVITPDSASKAYDGTALRKGTYTYTQDVLAEGDELTAVISGSITNFGTADNTVTSYKVMRGGDDVTDYYTFAEPGKGTLTITKRTVTLTSPDDSKTYDGTPLVNGNVSAAGFIDGEGAAYTATASRTYKGSCENTFTYELNAGTKADNYDISCVYGTLTINAIEDPITITANSKTRKYNGNALTDDGYDYTRNVLVNGDELVVEIAGSQTDVGESINQITSYKVMNGNKDVTGNYTINAPVNGKLKVTKRDVTLTSATDSKTYDGTALTNHNVTVGGDGFVSGEGAEYDVTGRQRDAGTSNNAFTYTLKDNTKASNYNITTDFGTLTVDPIATPIVITANGGNKIYDGTPYEASGYTYTEGVLLEGDVLTATVTGSITDAGTASSTITGYKVMRGDQDVTDNYTFGTSVPGTITIAKRPVTLTSGSSEKVYDGKPLTNDEVTVGGDGFVAGQGVTYDVTGSRTRAGVSDNEFTYSFNDGTKADNYEITKVKGTLKVTKRTAEIVITANSGSKVYDGTALTNDGFTYTGELAEGDRLTATVEGTITDAGSTANVVTGYAVKNAAGETVTDDYTFGESIDGTLIVDKKNVTLTSASDSKVYDGTALTNHEVTAEGFVGKEGATYDVTGSQKDVGNSKNEFTYELKEGTKADNYNITTIEGTLTVTKKDVDVVITANSNNKVYDGSPLTDAGYTFNEDALAAGDTLTATTAGTITNAGNTANTITDFQITAAGGENVTDNYTVQTVPGTLTVTKRQVTLTSATDNKAYDGTALRNNEVTVGGDGFADGEGATYNVTGSQLDVGDSKNTFTYSLTGKAKADNYDITKHEGTLTVTKKLTPINITANDVSKTYDGTPLNAGGYTFTEGILADGDRLVVEVSGSITDAGTEPSTVTTYKVMRGDKDVTDNYTIGQIKDGTLTIDKRDVTITSGSGSKVYDGTPLTNQNVTAAGFIAGQGISGSVVSGTITDVGSVKNAFAYTLNDNTKASNYNITKIEGDLEITKVTTPIVITADSAHKKYDGDALTDNGYTYTQGVLVNGDMLVATVEGTITDAGEQPNVVTGYKVMRGGVNVTDNYTFGTPVSGTLKVNPRNVTLTSGDAEKAYDGTAATNSQVTVSGDGFVGGLLNSEGATYNVTGSQLDVGESDNAFTYTLKDNTKAGNYNITVVPGKLKVTPNTTAIRITAETNSKEYDGTPLKANDYSFTEGVLADGDVLTAVVSGEITDAGQTASTITGYKVMRGNKDVTSNYTFTAPADGILSITPATLTVVTPSKTKTYDGTALTNPGVISGFVKGETATFETTGSQTKVGSSLNTYKITWDGTAKKDNYTIDESVGTLTVNEYSGAIDVTASTESVTYDGKNHGVTITVGDLPPGYTLEGTPTASAKAKDVDDGTVTAVCDNIVIRNAEGEDVTSKLNLNYISGSITITPAPIAVSTESANKVYNGQPLTAPGSMTGLVNGETATFTVTGSQKKVGQSTNTYEITWNGTAKASNYAVSSSLGTLAVAENASTITVAPREETYTYDGKPHGVDVDVLNLPEGYTVEEATSSTTVTDATGDTPVEAICDKIVIRNAEGEDVTDKLNLDIQKGKITINPAKLTVVTPNATKVYDGTALTAEGSISGLVNGETVTFKTTGKQEGVGSSDNTYKITWDGTAKEKNYSITETIGKLTINEFSGEIKIVTTGGKFVYDGKPHGATVAVEGLPQGYTVVDASSSMEVTHVDDGTVDATCDTLVIKNAAGEDVTGKLKITYVDDTIKIIPASLVIITDSASKAYDGQPLTAPGRTIGLVNGDTLGFAATGSQTAVGSSANTYNTVWSNLFNTQTAKENDYDVTAHVGTLTVTQNPDKDVDPNPPGPLGPGFTKLASLVTGTDGTVPMAGADPADTCCAFHFLLILAALIILIAFTRTMRKRQEEIFELKKKIKETK